MGWGKDGKIIDDSFYKWLVKNILCLIKYISNNVE